MRYLLTFLLLLGLVQTADAQTTPYRLRAGDTITVSVWQDPKLDRQLIVAPDGMISFPLVGQVLAGGMTLQAVAQALRQKLQANYRQDLDVTVALGSLAERAVVGAPPATFYVTGEVNSPGAYAIGGAGIDVLQAIALSGGFGTFAATRRILIHRQINGEDVLYRFNYRDFVSGRDFSGNIMLRPGDVVVVPEKNLFGQ